MKKGDIILLIGSFVLLIGVICLLFFKPHAGYATVYENGEAIASFPIDQDITEKIMTSDGHYNVLQIKDGEVSILEADCKNQICVNTMAVHQIGDSIICLPHKISVILEKDRQK